MWTDFIKWCTHTRGLNPLQRPSHIQLTTSVVWQNAICQFPWQQATALSKTLCQMTLAPWPFCQIRGLFVRVYLSQQRRPLHSYSQCSCLSGKERRPLNYTPAISFLSLCFAVRPCDTWLNPSQLKSSGMNAVCQTSFFCDSRNVQPRSENTSYSSK